jgi:hypothetical protein
MLTNQRDAPENAGFLRDDAALAVIFVADENDICAYEPLTSPMQTGEPDFHKYDPQEQEGVEYRRSCPGNISPDGAEVLTTLYDVKRNLPVFVGGILYDTLGSRSGAYAPLVDPGVEDECGFGYLAMIELAGGTTADVALASIDVVQFDARITALANAVAHQIAPITKVHLEHSPVAPLTVHQYNLPSHSAVEPDPSDYDPATNTVTLHDPGAHGTWVQINGRPDREPAVLVLAHPDEIRGDVAGRRRVGPSAVVSSARRFRASCAAMRDGYTTTQLPS